MRPVRTLLVTYFVPYPPDSGGKLVTWQTLAGLAQLGPVDLCAFTAPWARADGIAHLRRVARTVVTVPLARRSPALWFPICAARGVPYYILRDYSLPMRDRIRALLEDEYDLVFVDFLQMAPYLAGSRVPKVLQEHNVESYLAREFLRRKRNPIVQTAARWEVPHLERFERDHCNACGAVIALSEIERVRLQGLGVRVPISVIPPGVEPAEPVEESASRTCAVHIGTLHWPPVADGIRWYLREVHPRVRRELPAAELLLAGPRPPGDVAAWHGSDGVTVLDYVEDLAPVYRRAAVFIVPLFVGGGVRLKILNALARGLAVVSTSTGCDGLGLEPRQHLLVADSPDAFAGAVISVLREPALRRRLEQSGRSRVLEQFTPQRRYARIRDLVAAVRGGAPPAAEPQGSPATGAAAP